MSLLTIEEIEEFYKTCGIEVDKNKVMRNTINVGTLGNRLNTNYVTSYKDYLHQKTILQSEEIIK